MVLDCFLIAIFAATTSAQELCAIVYLAESHTCAQPTVTAVLSLACIIPLACNCLSSKCIQFNWSELKESLSLGNAQASEQQRCIHRKVGYFRT